MKKLIKTSWSMLFAVILLSGFMVSCDKADNSNNNVKVDPATIASSNLVAYFPFDAEPAAGSAVDKSNNTVKYVKRVGAASFVPGRRGNAYLGSASQAYLEYDVFPGSPLSSLNEFTISCWLKTPVTTTGVAKIFSLNGGDVFMGNLALIQESQIGDSVDIRVYLFDSGSTDWKGQDSRKNKTEFLNDKWFHFMALYRKSTSALEFYANGKNVLTQTKYAGPVPVTGTQPLLEEITLGNDMSKIFFGAWPQQLAGTPESWMTYFKGMVDEFRVYNRALTDTEAMDLYEAEVSQINGK